MAALNRAFGGPAGEPEDESEIDVTRIARVLAASAPVIAVVVVVVTVMVLVLSNRAESRYRATARIVATTTPTTAATTGTDPRQLATNVALLTTPDVLRAAARLLPGETGSSLRGKITTTTPTDADVIDVTASDSSAKGAAADANAVAGAFLQRQTANEAAAILRTRAALTAQLAGVGRGPAASAQAAAIRTRLTDLVVDEANLGNGLQLAQAAEAPAAPYAPRPLRNAIVAFIAALFLATVAVVLRDRLRPEASEERDLERVSGVPLIATLAPGEPEPPMGARLDALARRLESTAEGAPTVLRRPLLKLVDKRQRTRAARLAHARAAADDGLRSLLVAVLLALPPDKRHVILVTSAARGQGSARVAADLARGLAQAGQETLAVAADPWSSELADALGVAPSPGLTEALEQAQAGTGVRLRAATVPGLDTLHVVPAGGPSHDGVGLVRPGAVDALFVALGNTGYGYVVVDAPALLTAPEALLVARKADAAIVACLERCPADELVAARRALERLDVRVLGAVHTAPEPQPEREPEPEPEVVHVERVAGVAVDNGWGVRPAAEARLLIERLRTADQPLTFSQLRDALGGPPPSRVRVRLSQLVEGGDVVRRGSGRRDDPFVYGLTDQ